MIMQTNSKILYSLNEIKENGYQIKADIPEEKRCKFCNKILGVQGILNPFDRSINLFIQNDKCDCIESIKEKERLEKKRIIAINKDYEEYRKHEMNKKIKQYYGTDFITKQFEIQTIENFITNEANINMKYTAMKFLERFSHTKKGIIFIGKNGTGKTHIASGIANELMKRNVPVIFGTLTELLDKYSESYKNHTEIELTKLYAKVDLLVIDDLGVEVANDWMLSKLFIILNERIKNELPIIITSNYEFAQLKQRLSIQNKVCETTNSIISRLCAMCCRVECKGKDYRMI